MLAGLINDSESRSGAGVPYLNETPVLGRLFGSRKDAHKKTEVVLLITPRVVRNLNQQNLPVSPMPSGTESQPGAAPWQLSKGQAQAQPGQGASRAGVSGVAMNGGSNGAGVGAGPAAPSLFSGPEQVQPGGGFTLGLNNRSDQPLSLSLQFDASVLSSAEANQGVTVPPRGRQAVSFTVRPGASSGPTTVTSSTGEQFTLRVGMPGAQGDAAEPMPAEPSRDPTPEPADGTR